MRKKLLYLGNMLETWPDLSHQVKSLQKRQKKVSKMIWGWKWPAYPENLDVFLFRCPQVIVWCKSLKIMLLLRRAHERRSRIRELIHPIQEIRYCYGTLSECERLKVKKFCISSPAPTRAVCSFRTSVRLGLRQSSSISLETNLTMGGWYDYYPVVL